jgi:hypothetical protein
MPPEQFERSPLDARSDLYSMGCVYYQALAGVYPFDGATGAEVMGSHLHHAVKPLNEVRSNIPLWVCDWVMWHINRFPQDRPESAREALSVFLNNDRIKNPPMSLGYPQPAPGPPRPRLIIPGAGPATQALPKAKLVETSQVATPAKEPGVTTHTAPQPLAPPEGFKPSVHTSLHDLPEIEPTQAPAHHPSATAAHRGARPVSPGKKPFRLSKNAKIGLAVIAGILLLILGLFLMKSGKQKRDARIVAGLLEEASKPGANEVTLTGTTLQLILKAAAKTDSNADLQKIARALTVAKSTDGTDVDERVADFATQDPGISLRAKEILISEVLRNRNNPVIMPAMLEFAATSDAPDLVVAALQAIRQMTGDREFETFLKLIETTDNNLIREAAVINIEEILRKSANVEELAKQLKSAHASNIRPNIQIALKRLIDFSNSIKPQEP